jgi:transposase
MDLTGSVIVHDRYQNYDSAQVGKHLHQLCCAHLLRDLDGAAEVYPSAAWPEAISGALRELIHQANLAREHEHQAIDPAVKDQLIKAFRHGVLVGLAETGNHGTRPGEKARLLLEVFRDRPGDVLCSPTTWRYRPHPTRPNRTYGPARSSRTSPGGYPAKTARKTDTPSGATSPPRSSTD